MVAREKHPGYTLFPLISWYPKCLVLLLTHWGRATHLCVGYLTIIGSHNGLSPSRRQAIIWTNVGILLIGPLGINFSEILIEIHKSSLKKMHLKMSSGKCRPFCLGLHVLTYCVRHKMADNSRKTFSNAFSCMIMFAFQLKFHCSLFLMV